jgi:hypothetical protein
LVKGEEKFMKKKLLAVFLALMTVTFGAVPMTVSAADTSDTSSDTVATQSSETITLNADNCNTSITVTSGQTVTLYLNNQTLTNTSGEDTITVEYGGTLIIEGPGTIQNTSSGKTMIYNNGTTTLNGDITLDRPNCYTEVKEETVNGKVVAKVYGNNTFYSIMNHGDMTINNVTIELPNDHNTSIIENGYTNYTSGNSRSGFVTNENSANPTLTINDANIVGGNVCVKNDDGGILTINGGNFSGGTSAINNWNIAEINGGTFSNTHDIYYRPYCLLLNHGYVTDDNENNKDKGQLTINGGVFTQNSLDDSIFYRSTTDDDCMNDVTINGGTFTGDLYPDGDLSDDSLNDLTITGGVFTQDVSEALADNLTLTTETIDGVTYYEIAPDDTTTTVVPEKYDINIGDTSNGTVTASSTSAEKDETVTLTVTPADGYELDTITASDANSTALELTENSDGTYTFTMPESDVNVSATFKAKAEEPEEPETPSEKKFTDVPEGAYYYDPVYWAVENGITAGTSDTTFTPDGICTRAEVVTFLYRQAGSPSVTGTSKFTDVASDAYYYDAVVWAEQNGIAAGTSETTFSPDQTINRAQAVSFMYRAAKATASSAENPFTDVEKGSYYYDAVTWSAENNITVGTSATTFSPEKSCTRAEIVTFLYRESQNTAS